MKRASRRGEGNMSRRFYLVSYEVADHRCRDRLAKLLMDYGDRIQFSVSCCELNPRERVWMFAEIRERLNGAEDPALVVELGPVEGPHPRPDMAVLGRPLERPPRGRII